MTKLGWWMVVCFLTVATAACGPNGEVSKPAVKATIEQDLAAITRLRNEYAAAWKVGSAEGVARLYASDAMVLYPNQPPVAGRPEILTYFKGFYDQFVQDNFELTSEEVQVTGAWALDRGPYRLSMTPRKGGNPIQDNGKYLVILQRQADGSWKVARDMDNSNRPLSQAQEKDRQAHVGRY